MKTLRLLSWVGGMVRPCIATSFFLVFGPVPKQCFEERCHAPFIIGSQILETCLLPLNSLSDFTVVFFCSFDYHLM